ncbi:MAG: PAS domain S-box protein, partial [Desulfobacterales bacterium]|nr:PAS domain S-box protein [Desulfobacterales bacterium]
MKFRSKLIVGFSIPITMLIIIGGINILFFSRFVATVDDLTGKALQTERAVNKGRILISQIHGDILYAMIMFMGDRTANLRTLDEHASAFYDVLDRLEELHVEDREDIGDLRSRFQTFYIYGKWILKLPDLDYFKSHPDLILRFTTQKKRVMGELLKAFSVYETQFRESLMEVHEASGAAALVSNATMVSGVLLTILISLFISSTLTKPVSRLIHAVKEIERGNLAARARVESGDEIGVLSRSFNDMTLKLSENFDELKQEIHRRKRSEANLRNNEELLKAVLNATDNGVLAVDDNGEVISANARFHEMWRIPDHLLRAKKNDKLLAHVLDQVEDPDRFLAGVEELYAGPAEREDVILFKDGRVFVRFSRPMAVDDGDVGRVWSFRDVTEREAARRELERLRNLLSNIVNSMPSVLVGVDRDGNVTQWNRKAEEITGVAAAQARGQRVDRVYPGLRVGMDMVRQAIDKREPLVDAKTPRRIRGETRYEDVTVYPLISNGVEGAVIRIDDVTERVRIEEMMIQSEKMMSVGGLAAGIAHEINNPLAGVLQNIQVMRNRLKGGLPKNRRVAGECGVPLDKMAIYLERRGILRMMDTVMASGARASRIVSNMLDFSRKSESVNAPRDPNALLDSAVELAGNDYDLKKKYDFRRIEIIREYDPDVGKVRCDKTKIQ